MNEANMYGSKLFYLILSFQQDEDPCESLVKCLVAQADCALCISVIPDAITCTDVIAEVDGCPVPPPAVPALPPPQIPQTCLLFQNCLGSGAPCSICLAVL